MTLFGKRVLAGVMKLKISRRDCPGLSRWALNAITRESQESGHTHTQKRRPREEGEERGLKMLALKMGAMWPQAKGFVQPSEEGRGEEGVSPRASAGNLALPTPELEPSDNDGGLLPSRTVRE